MAHIDDLTSRVSVLCLDVSLHRLDGGGRRVQAFLGALRNLGCEVSVVGLGPTGVEDTELLADSRLHRIKRNLFPVPFSRRPESTLRGKVVPGQAVVSLIPFANRSALNGRPVWLDFPDLWSEVAIAHSRTVNPVSALMNRAQAGLWSVRERSQVRRADVASFASWSDWETFKDRGLWLPTPIGHLSDMKNRRRRSFAEKQPVVGFLANFDYPPNIDAYRRLTREWLTRLREFAQRIDVAGFGSDKLPRFEGINIVGPVERIEQFYERIDVSVVPVQTGGGMKVKAVEAMMMGVPVIVTRHVKQGLPESLAENCVELSNIPRRASLSTLSAIFRDPRERPSVARALESFTHEHFDSEISRTWAERMARNG